MATSAVPTFDVFDIGNDSKNCGIIITDGEFKDVKFSFHDIKVSAEESDLLMFEYDLLEYSTDSGRDISGDDKTRLDETVGQILLKIIEDYVSDGCPTATNQE